ncbi:MAG: hypothetical protein HXX81_06680 [Campylobacterales bacterium]|nr:hypothetical protein [Campylobacterales bacterium]
MTLKNEYNGSACQQFEVSNITEIDNIFVGENLTLGKMAFYKDKAIFCENDLSRLNEMIYFVPFNTLESATILYIGDRTFNIDSLVDFIPTKFDTVCDVLNYSLSNKKLISFNDLKDKQYDLIIVDNKLHESFYFEDEFLAKIKATLKNDGIFICSNVDFDNDKESFKSNLSKISSLFRISMPYKVTTSINGSGNFIFSSNKYHPTSDIILDKSDFLDDCFYYNSEIHLQSFILPNYIKKELLNIAKN